MAYIANVPLVLKRGASLRQVFTYKINGQPVDLTDMTARMQVRKKSGEPVILEASTENDKLTLGGATGTITLHFTNDDTVDVVAGLYKYDIVLQTVEPPDDAVYLVEGSFVVNPSITETVQPL